MYGLQEMSKVIKMKKQKDPAWKDMSRNQKRRQTFYIGKRPYTIFEILKIAEKDLPLMLNKDNKRMNHYDNMLKLYMDGGMDEVKRYNKTIFGFQDKIERRIKRKCLWQKILGLLMVWKASLKPSEGAPNEPSKEQERERVAS